MKQQSINKKTKRRNKNMATYKLVYKDAEGNSFEATMEGETTAVVTNEVLVTPFSANIYIAFDPETDQPLVRVEEFGATT